MTDLQKEFESTGYSSWINSDIYPNGKVYTNEYVLWLEEKINQKQEKPAKESKPAKEIISEIICKECGKEGDLDLEGIWCANCQKYTYSEKPAKENIDLMGQIPIISLANSMFGKPTKEEREWEVGDMVRITKKLINQEDLEIGCEVEVVEYDANDNTWWVEDVFCRYYGWITTEEAVLINKNQ